MWVKSSWPSANASRIKLGIANVTQIRKLQIANQFASWGQKRSLDFWSRIMVIVWFTNLLIVPCKLQINANQQKRVLVYEFSNASSTCTHPYPCFLALLLILCSLLTHSVRPSPSLHSLWEYGRKKKEKETNIARRCVSRRRKNTVGVSKQRKSFSNLAVCGHEQTNVHPGFFLKKSFSHFFNVLPGPLRGLHVRVLQRLGEQARQEQHFPQRQGRPVLQWPQGRYKGQFCNIRALQMLKLGTQKTLQNHWFSSMLKSFSKEKLCLLIVLWLNTRHAKYRVLLMPYWHFLETRVPFWKVQYFLCCRLRRVSSTCCMTWMMPWTESAGLWGSSSGCPCSGCTRWRPGGGTGGRKRKRKRPSSRRKEESGRNNCASQHVFGTMRF